MNIVTIFFFVYKTWFMWVQELFWILNKMLSLGVYRRGAEGAAAPPGICKNKKKEGQKIR